MPSGRHCGAPPGRDSAFDSGTTKWADEVAEHSALVAPEEGERTIAAAYDFTGLARSTRSVRIIEVATTDALSLENSIARVRALISAARLPPSYSRTGESRHGSRPRDGAGLCSG